MSASRTKTSPDFPAWLRREIEDRVWTFGEFAQRAGVPRATLESWLAGTYRPRGINVVRIARTLGVSRDVVESHLPPKTAAA